MLDVLNFVRGAVATGNQIVPVLTHFCIYGNRIQGANGRIHIDSACVIDFEGVVPAEKFLRAMDACDGHPSFRFTDANKLVIERKPFRAYLPHQSVESFPKAEPTPGERYWSKKASHPALLPTLRALRPFMSDDAERAWASTVLFHRESNTAFATNSAMIAMLTKAAPFHADVQLPIFCVDELLRIGREPLDYAVDSSSITFFWGDQWLKSQLIVAEWPVKTAQEWLAMKAKMLPIPKDLAKLVESIVPFCEDPKFPVIHFSERGITTAPGETQGQIEGVNIGSGAFRADNLAFMLACSDKIAIAEKCGIFSGPDNFKGVMSLLRI